MILSTYNLLIRKLGKLLIILLDLEVIDIIHTFLVG